MTREKILELFSKELVSLAFKDQEMTLNSQKKAKATSFNLKLRKRNTERLKKIVKQIGWPKISEVGEETSYAAWYIVQHSDFDINFQKDCLSLMKKLSKKDVFAVNIAYLTDRIAVNTGKLQVFGTQFFLDEKGIIKPRPIKDLKSLEKKRKKMGLEPFEVYWQKMEGKYQWPKGYINPKIGCLYKVI